MDAPWNQSAIVSDEKWIDDFVYLGYRQYGPEFLAALKGRFAVARLDPEKGALFLVRDWIGEMPLHYLATPRAIYVANTIGAIKDQAGGLFSYQYARAFPHAHLQEFDLNDVEEDCVALTMRPGQPRLFFDFSQLVSRKALDIGYSVRPATFKEHFYDSIRRRIKIGGERHAVLLSGGLDSFCVALTMKTLGIDFDAYTLSVEGAGDDVSMAANFARTLGITHHVVRVAAQDVVNTFEEAVKVSEYYPLYDVYCAVGMVHLARGLAELGVTRAFCGEAVNEAVGDYKDWIVDDPRTGHPLVLQRINESRFQRGGERELLVWGHADIGAKYNRQHGTGLAKHAGSRMIKPFLARGLTLECPYYEPDLLAHLVAIPAEILREMGGKQGLVTHIFQDELERWGVDLAMIESSKKVRLQDASEGGRGGITSLLLAAGCDQRRAIEIFNREFSASLDPVHDARRLAWSDQSTAQ